MKQSEKTLIGAMMLAGGIALVALVGLPQWDAFSNNQAQITALNDEIKALDTQKVSLNAEITTLEKNTIIPDGIEVQKYTEKNREQLVKGMLDKVVNMATDSGNLFISLAPSDDKDKDTPPPAAKTTAAPDSNDANSEAAAPPAPVLEKFGYELAIRGTYNSIQNFLRTLDQQKSLIEISTLKLENEQGTSNPSPDSFADPFHPIKVTAKVQLGLQPVNP